MDFEDRRNLLIGAFVSVAFFVAYRWADNVYIPFAIITALLIMLPRRIILIRGD